MGRWVSTISNLHHKATFGLSQFAVDCLDFNFLGPSFEPGYHVSCCKGYRPANRGRERGCCGNQMCLPFNTAFPLFGPYNPLSHSCFVCAHFQAALPLPNTPAQNREKFRQKTMLIWSLRLEFGTAHLNYASKTIRRLRSVFESLCRNYSSMGAVAGLKPMPKMVVLETDDTNDESEADHGDETSEEEYRDNQEECEDSGKSVDFGEFERVYKVVEELFASYHNMEAALDRCGVSLSHTLVYHVLVRFSNARKPAFRFFRWAGQQVGFSHNSLTYNMMMRISGRAKQFTSMCELLDEMCKNGSVLTIETFEIAIKAFVAGREMKKAVQMFTLMEKHNLKANIDNFNTILDALGRAKLVKEAQMLFETMREMFPPDAKTYTVLLSGWCKVRKLIEAGKLWNEMVDGGFVPDLATHNIMLEGLFKGKRTREAVKLFTLMKTNGPLPNAMSYTIVICALSKLQKMDGAMKFFMEMQENGCSLDATVYTCLITGYGTTNELDRAYELLQEMKNKGIPHDCRIYNALIKVVVNLRKPDEATKFFDEMIQCGIEPTIHTYNMLMELYFSTKKFEMGLNVWNQMAQNGCSPDVNSYTVFIGGLIREGRSQEACTYIESMIEKGMKAPHFDYNKFLADFSRAGRPDIFEELAQKMKYAGKLGVANMFIKFSQKTKKRMKRRHIPSVGPVLSR
ncbi:hypothetical protein SUGI_0609220 [Cryptomeria japonica]|uniref:pentatricopeptide repeat-containing protein At3g62470, mitochondrial n=1 Tax=Cryptomeria japonica TaxID=3369 RepID=UPI002414C4A2|nr:pentatricopeptide repeat-containing protein At3g62470, mitochondrial [Cryptomeria japonica]XP_059063308.1 pentatricopeptide repeat-containing protein At3g62470, mitochondrial [Cryptomeria japonica]GLJ30741.1 hypothetical protein SUGI_0609220 [Cryptomeria japonica]